MYTTKSLTTCGILTLNIIPNWLLNAFDSISLKLETCYKSWLFKQLGKTVWSQDYVKMALDFWKLNVAFESFNKIDSSLAILVLILTKVILH